MSHFLNSWPIQNTKEFYRRFSCIWRQLFPRDNSNPPKCAKKWDWSRFCRNPWFWDNRAWQRWRPAPENSHQGTKLSLSDGDRGEHFFRGFETNYNYTGSLCYNHNWWWCHWGGSEETLLSSRPFTLVVVSQKICKISHYWVSWLLSPDMCRYKKALIATFFSGNFFYFL